MDANFRLKNRERVIVNDISLSDGWGHWVPFKPFQEYIEAHSQDADVSILYTRISLSHPFTTSDKPM